MTRTDETVTQDVTFKAQCDGTEQKYVLLFPKTFTASVPHDLLIALHGHGSDRWQFINQERDECRVARDFAAEHEMLFVSPDYRASTSWMGPKAEADVVQMITDLKQAYRVLVHPKIIINPQRRGLPSHIGRGHVSQVVKKPRRTGTVARQGRRAVMPHHPLPIAPRGFQKNIAVTQGIGDLNAGFESRFAKQGGGLLHPGSRFRVGFQ